MNKLLVSNFTRLFKNTSYRVCIIFSAGIALSSVLITYLDIHANPENYANLGPEFLSADTNLFTGAVYLSIAIAAFISIFLGTEYSDGTIRNKLIIGHSRAQIFLSNYIICMSAAVILLLINIAVTYTAGQLLLEKSCFTVKQLFLYSLTDCLAFAALTAILVLTATMIQTKALGSIVSLIMVFVMLLAAATLNQILNDPDYVLSIGGTTREVYTFINTTLPENQIFQLAPGITPRFGSMMLSSGFLIVLINSIGIILFRKKDLK